MAPSIWLAALPLHTNSCSRFFSIHFLVKKLNLWRNFTLNFVSWSQYFLISLYFLQSTSVRSEVHVFQSVICWCCVFEAEGGEFHLLLFQISTSLVSQQKVPKAWLMAACLSTLSSIKISSRKTFSFYNHINFIIAFFDVDGRNSW